jgi:Uma2 family endonuclease
MSTLIAQRRYTPDDLLRLPDGDRYELVNGNLVERHMSFWSSYVAGRIFQFLSLFCQDRALGWVAPEGTSYRCFPHAPELVRKPDVSFIAVERLSLEQATREGHLSIAPDLAVEVVSPNDEVYDLDQKLLDFFSAGVRMVWVVNPQAKTVRVHRPQGPIQELRENDEVTGDDVVAGFRCRVGDFFLAPSRPDHS